MLVQIPPGSGTGARHLATLAVLIAAAFVLPACSSTIANLPRPIGLPADAPARPATPLAYPAVHDMPPERVDVTLSEDERKRIEHELRAARDRQQSKKRPKPRRTGRADAGPTGGSRNP